MTDDIRTKLILDDSEGDWNDDIANWELSLDGIAQAESSPFPLTPAQLVEAPGAAPEQPEAAAVDAASGSDDADFADLTELAEPSELASEAPPNGALAAASVRPSRPATKPPVEDAAELFADDDLLAADEGDSWAPAASAPPPTPAAARAKPPAPPLGALKPPPPPRPRMYQPPTPEEAARLARSAQKTLPPPDLRSFPAALARDDEGEPDLVDALLDERSSRPSQPQPVRGSGAHTPAPLHEHALPTPLVEAGPGARLEVLLDSSEITIGAGEESVPPEHAASYARIARLEALARKPGTSGGAELLVSAAELAEGLGDVARAERLLQRALADAPRNKSALGALAGLAFRAGDLPRYVQLLERLTELPQSRGERAKALCMLALARWQLQRDLPAALGGAAEAQTLAPEQIGPALLLARIETAAHPARVDGALTALAPRTQDVALAAMWLVGAGRAIELRGDRAAARAMYARAASLDPFAFDAQLSLARMEHALGAHGAAARALLNTLESFDIGPVAEAVRRRAAHMLACDGGHAEALGLLEHASDDVALRTGMQIALDSDDDALKAQAAEAWSLGTDGAERALALLTQAELLVEQGELERAESSLELAALADPSQTLVSVAREALARRSGDAAKLASIVAAEEAGRGALAAAAKLALTPGASAEELTWLLDSLDDARTGAHVLAIDASAELARIDELRSVLNAEAERGSNEARAAVLLALAELERKLNEREAFSQTLRRASELAPDDLALGRTYARARPSSEELVRLYGHEAERSSGGRAAFAQLRAGYAQAEGSAGRLSAFVAAYAADSSYAPASWALHREARRQGDLATLGQLHAREGERAQDARARVGHLVRAALVRASEDSKTAALELTEALTLTPDDPVLAELVIRLGDASPAAVRVEALDRMALRAREPFRRALLLAAAGTLEDERRVAEAAERYRAVLADAPHDPIALSGLERLSNGADSPEALLEHKLRAAAEASTEAARARALEELLLLSRDPRASEWAHELLALVPSHPLALRWVERELLTADDRPALAALESRYLDASRGPADRAARLRFVHLLHALEPEDESKLGELDRKVIECAQDARHSAWLTRSLMSSAIALDRRDLVVRAVELLREHSSEPIELSLLAVQRGWLTVYEQPEQVERTVREAAEGYPDHPTQLELLAEAKRASGELAAAAEEFERAAERAHSNERAAHLWLRAAELWDSRLSQPERAATAYHRALACDIDAPGARERIETLLATQGDVDGLIALTHAQIARGGNDEQLSELQRKLAELHERKSDAEAARKALRSALAHAPESLPAWSDLARLAQRTGQHEERVEALLAVTRISRDPLELRDAFLELGSIYEGELPDRARAISAYQRVLKLGPRNTRAFERLAHLYRLEGKHELAAETLAQLARSTGSESERRDVTLQLAQWKEEQGDARGAEELIESLRKHAPTDPIILRALTATLRRASAHSALGMHLSRAASDLRQALGAEFGNTDTWRALVEVLVERGRVDMASQCAAAAHALGLEIEELAPHLPARADALALGSAGLSELLDDLVYPESAPAGLRILFRHGGEALNRTAPLDLRALGADKLDKRHPLRALVTEHARWVAHRDIELYASAELPCAFVPVQDAPIELLVGTRLLDDSTEAERRFLIARALKLARAQMSIACRLSPSELELLLHGLVRWQLPTYAPAFPEAAAIDDAARRVAKNLSKRAHAELMPIVLELTYESMPRFDGPSVYGVASSAASRAALLATGDIEAAVTGLIKLAALSSARTDRLAAAAQIDELRDLITFALSDSYFEALARAGKEAR